MGSQVKSLQYNGVVRDGKLLWVLGNYSRFVRPGIIRIECSLPEEQSPENGVLVSAYTDVKEGQVVHVFTNLSEQTRQVHIGPDKQVRAYTTDETRNLELSIQSLNNIDIATRSVVTVLN